MSAVLIKKKREERDKAVADARSIVDAAGKEKRDLTKDEETKVDAYFSDADKLKAEIDGLVKGELRKAKLDEYDAELEESRGRQTNPRDPERGNPEEENREDEGPDPKLPYSWKLHRRSLKKPITVIHKAGSAEHRRHMKAYREQFSSVLGLEQRALQSDLDTAGGYIVAPEEFVGELLRDVDDATVMRQLARSFTTGAQSIGVPKRTAKMAAFNWGGELTTPAQDTALKFGKRAMMPHYMTGEILVSRDLLRSAVMNVDAIVREEIARDSGELEERGFMTGSGAEQPLGVFTLSSDGIGASRDVSSGNQATSIQVDGLINAKFSLKQKYRAMAQWLFHRDAISQIRKLKDGTGQYLWQPAVVAGEPDRILNLPVNESEWVPNTFTSGQYVGMLAAWSYYWIVDSLDLGLQVLIEKYAESNQVAYLARRKVDGAPTVEEAFARVKLG